MNINVKKRVNNPNEKLYYNATDVVALLGISKGKSCKIMQEMNGESYSKDFPTIVANATAVS